MRNNWANPTGTTLVSQRSLDTLGNLLFKPQVFSEEEQLV